MSWECQLSSAINSPWLRHLKVRLCHVSCFQFIELWRASTGKDVGEKKPHGTLKTNRKSMLFQYWEYIKSTLSKRKVKEKQLQWAADKGSLGSTNYPFCVLLGLPSSSGHGTHWVVASEHKYKYPQEKKKGGAGLEKLRSITNFRLTGVFSWHWSALGELLLFYGLLSFQSNYGILFLTKMGNDHGWLHKLWNLVTTYITGMRLIRLCGQFLRLRNLNLLYPQMHEIGLLPLGTTIFFSFTLLPPFTLYPF